MNRLKVITSYAGHARFFAELEQDGAIIGYIDRQRSIPTPYASGPNHAVYEWNGKRIFMCETRHKRYEIFEVPAQLAIHADY